MGTWLFVVAILSIYGNACSNQFSIRSDDSSLNIATTCKADIPAAAKSQFVEKVGYLGASQVKYVSLPNNWIQLGGDRLLRSKGDLPTSPLPQGLRQGVGVQVGERWPSGRIPYVIEGNVPSQSRILEAIAHWNTYLAGVITLVPRSSETDYMDFKGTNSGCAAPVGYSNGAGAHPVYLSAGCTAGNVVHEIGHIVGLDHEQSRPDRDSYVEIRKTNISRADQANFDISPTYVGYNFYDFGSIMHYPFDAFSINGLDTIIPKVTVPSGINVGQRDGLSSGDIDSVRLMYGYAAINGGSGTVNTDSDHGLFARYYDGATFSTVIKDQIDANIYFSWGENPPTTGLTDKEKFSIRWTGYLVAPTTGTYRFRVEAMDPLRVTISGEEIFVFKGDNATREAVSISYELTAGQRYPIMIDYSSVSGDNYLRLYWQRTGGGAEVAIPQSAFLPNSDSSLLNACSGAWLSE